MLVRRYASLTARLPASEATTPRARVCATSGALPMSTGLVARRALGSAALLVYVAFPAWSDTGLDRASDADALQTIVITATRIPTPELDLASSVTVVRADEIAARQERTFAEVLKNIPGLNVVQQGGPGAETSVFMRGTNSNHTKVLVDGIDVSDPSNANAAFDFGQLLTQDIQTVEILRGPQSGLYGADALGGVISIITKKGEGPPKITGMAEGGSFGTFNQTASASGSEQNFNYALNIGHFRSTDTPVTPLELLPPGRFR